MDHIEYERHGDIVVLRINNPPVNALSQAVRHGLMTFMDRAESDPEVRAVLLVGAGRAFIAGADIKEFGKPPLEPQLPQVCDRIEASPLLVVASLHGVSLGGGLEVALSAHYRIAQPQARVGLPEVHLGLIPGAGGTQRLPRLTGALPAIDAITSGRHIPAGEALDMGIVDKIEGGDPQEVGLGYTQELLRDGVPRRVVSQLPGPEPIDWDKTYDTVLKKGRGQIAPAQAVRAVQASAELPFSQGLQAERDTFWTLMETDQRQGMIHTFFSQRAVSVLPELKGVEPRDVNKTAVIGGGTMGAGIATALLLSGLSVVLIEQDSTAAQTAFDRVSGYLAAAAARGKLSQSHLNEITTRFFNVATDYALISDVDLVIEAVFEDMDAKKQVFRALDAQCRPDTIFATNTSYLDVQEIAASVSHSERVIGLHFFSPAHIMKLLEVVVPDTAAPEVVATGFALGKRLGKVSIRAGVCEGFIGNRILTAFRAAADHMALDGASPFQIDNAVTAFGIPMGPFAMSDLAGLDIAWAMRRRRAPTRDPRERVGAYADKLCEAGHFGQKSGKGFYIYPEDKSAPQPNPEVISLIEAERKDRGISARAFSNEEIIQRYLSVMVNEAAKVVAEGIARRPLDVDMAMVFGYGFPRHWGGPLKWADIIGPGKVLADIEIFAAEDRYFWAPAPLLKEIVAKGKRFDDLNA